VRSLILELLQMLSEEKGFAELLESIGGVPGVVTQFTEAALAEKKNFTHILCLLHVLVNISRSNKARTSLNKTYLLPSVVKILSPEKELLVPLDALASIDGQNAQELKKKQSQIEYKVVEVISNLSVNDEMKVSMAQANLIPLLVQFLTRAGASTDEFALQIGGTAVRAIALLAFNESNRDAIREAGGLEAVAQILRTPTLLGSGSPTKGKGTDREAINTMAICNSAWALEVLCFNTKNRDVLLFNGGIPALISLLSCPEEEIQSVSVRTLRNLSCFASVAQLFVVSNLGVKYLLDILYTCNNDFVLIHALELIQNLLLFDATRNMVLETITKAGVEKLKAHLWNRALLQSLLVALEMLLGN